MSDLKYLEGYDASALANSIALLAYAIASSDFTMADNETVQRFSRDLYSAFWRVYVGG